MPLPDRLCHHIGMCMPGFLVVLAAFAQARQTFDPNGRLLNDYFRDLLARTDSAAGQ